MLESDLQNSYPEKTAYPEPSIGYCGTQGRTVKKSFYIFYLMGVFIKNIKNAYSNGRWS